MQSSFLIIFSSTRRPHFNFQFVEHYFFCSRLHLLFLTETRWMNFSVANPSQPYFTFSLLNFHSKEDFGHMCTNWETQNVLPYDLSFLDYLQLNSSVLFTYYLLLLTILTSLASKLLQTNLFSLLFPLSLSYHIRGCMFTISRFSRESLWTLLPLLFPN